MLRPCHCSIWKLGASGELIRCQRPGRLFTEICQWSVHIGRQTEDAATTVVIDYSYSRRSKVRQDTFLGLFISGGPLEGSLRKDPPCQLIFCGSPIMDIHRSVSPRWFQMPLSWQSRETNTVISQEGGWTKEAKKEWGDERGGIFWGSLVILFREVVHGIITNYNRMLTQ